MKLRIIAVAAALCMIPAASHGGLIFVTDSATGTIGEYTTSGATINPALITGLNAPTGIALSGGHLFVANGAAAARLANTRPLGRRSTPL